MCQISGLRPVATLWAGSGIVATLVAVLDVARLAMGSRGPVGIHNLVQFSFADRLWRLLGFDFAGFWPGIMALRFALDHAWGLLLFLGLAIAAGLLVTWTFAALAFPAVQAAVGRRPAGAEDRRGGRLWGRAYPLGVVAFFALPAISGAVLSLLGEGRGAVKMAATIAIAVAVWFFLMAVFRRPEGVGRFLRISLGLSVAFVALSLGGVAAAVVIESSPFEPARPAWTVRRPNILLVSIDSLRADHLHCYGYPRDTSPTIDGVAGEGVLFKTVASPTSWTLPAHLTLLTSLPPEQHAVVVNGLALNEDALCLAQVLSQAGYATAGFVCGPYMRSEYGFARGFDHYDDRTLVEVAGNDCLRIITSPKLIQLVEGWLRAWDDEARVRPFFLFVHMWDVHHDYIPPPPYDTMFDPNYQGTVTGENFFANEKVHKDMDPRDLEHVIALYDGEIRFTDDHLGRLLDVMRDLGVLDDTIVVITADHGDEFFEHGKKAHGQTLYDEVLLVPLVIRFPAKVPAGKVVEQQVRLMDIAPTILSLAGLEQPAAFGITDRNGPHVQRDLTPLFAPGPTKKVPPLVAFGDLRATLASVRTDTVKLVRGRRERELYDLSKDPGEQTNLWARDPSNAEALTRTLSVWRRRSARLRRTPRRIVLTEDHKQRLRNLGYLK